MAWCVCGGAISGQREKRIGGDEMGFISTNYAVTCRCHTTLQTILHFVAKERAIYIHSPNFLRSGELLKDQMCCLNLTSDSTHTQPQPCKSLSRSPPEFTMRNSPSYESVHDSVAAMYCHQDDLRNRWFPASQHKIGMSRPTPCRLTNIIALIGKTNLGVQLK